MKTRYLIIMPCRDEAEFLQKTIDSIAAQTIKPAKWLVVDDGSTDATPELLARAQEDMDYLQVLRREDRGKRSVGPGVMDTFYAGLAIENLDEYDFVCKLDGDLEFKPGYFERLLELMHEDPLLGNVSGKLFLDYDGEMVEERLRSDNAIGPCKFYRVSCFKDIGGFVRQVSWDGIDGHICRMNGWIPTARDEEVLQVTHLRRMGSSEISFWEGRQRHGRGKYFMGSRFYFVFAMAVYRMFERPFIIGGIGIVYGYLKAMFKSQDRYDNPEYLRFFRRYELQSLLLGRDRTTAKFDEAVRKQHAQVNENLISSSS